MQLQQILNGENLDKNLSNIEIKSITNNSKDISKNCLFFAECGINSHGLDYLNSNNLENIAIICWQAPYNLEKIDKYNKHKDKFIEIKDFDEKINQFCFNFFGENENCHKIAITGTNGKTSIANFIAQLTDFPVIGTTGFGNINNLQELNNTTPNALLLQKIISDLETNNKGIAIEVSSHALSLKRVSNINNFKTAIFTNLSQDHLDFHKNIEDYFQVKSKLFKFKSIENVIVNLDDNYGEKLLKIVENKKIFAYGNSPKVKEQKNYIHISKVSLSMQGIQCLLDICLPNFKEKINFKTKALGEFNIYNLVAAIITCSIQDFDFMDILKKAEQINGVLGRIQPVYITDKKLAIIDYSHTSDALESILKTLRKQTTGKIYTVFGCGGDRDKSKRPLMAEAVNEFSDFGIITDDNPRTENSKDIITDILKANINKEKFKIISERKEAIYYGLSILKDNDILLIAGKGHEEYQIVGKQKKYFSDFQTIKDWTNENNK